MGNILIRHLKFWSAWLRGPRHVGAVVPSSPALAEEMARAMAAALPGNRPGMVIELGGGTGAISRALLKRIPPARLAIIERDPELAALLVGRFPGVRVICGDATRLPELMAAEGIEQVICIVSALPLLSLPDADRQAIIRGARRILPPGGRFLQFTYGFREPFKIAANQLAGWHIRRLKWIVFNLPPAFIWSYEVTSPDVEAR